MVFRCFYFYSTYIYVVNERVDKQAFIASGFIEEIYGEYNIFDAAKRVRKTRSLR